jgi:hypothetical protein
LKRQHHLPHALLLSPTPLILLVFLLKAVSLEGCLLGKLYSVHQMDFAWRYRDLVAQKIETACRQVVAPSPHLLRRLYCRPSHHGASVCGCLFSAIGSGLNFVHYTRRAAYMEAAVQRNQKHRHRSCLLLVVHHACLRLVDVGAGTAVSLLGRHYHRSDQANSFQKKCHHEAVIRLAVEALYRMDHVDRLLLLVHISRR